MKNLRKCVFFLRQLNSLKFRRKLKTGVKVSPLKVNLFFFQCFRFLDILLNYRFVIRVSETISSRFDSFIAGETRVLIIEVPVFVHTEFLTLSIS